MYWFERHLNWAMVLAWLFAPAIGFFCGLFIKFVFESTIGSAERLEDSLVFPIFVISVGLMTWATGWAIHKKGRSL